MLEFSVVVDNFAVLAFGYSEHAANAVMSELQRRAATLRGAPALVHQRGNDRFIWSIKASEADAQSDAGRPIDPSLLAKLMFDLALSPVVVGRHLLVASVTIEARSTDRGSAVDMQAPARVAHGAARLSSWCSFYRSYMRLAARVFAAIEDERMALLYQKVADRSGGEPLFYECRPFFVEDIDKPPASRAEVERALEELGFIAIFDYWVVKETLELLRANPSLRLSCKISALNLDETIWWAALLAELVAAPDLARRLIVEVSGPWPTLQPRATYLVLDRLRDCGCRIAVAGFDGSPQTAHFAMTCRPDIIKITMRAVREMESPQGVIDSAKLLSSCLVFEGVEGVDDADEREVLSGTLTPWVQGKAVSAPCLALPIGVACRETFPEAGR